MKNIIQFKHRFLVAMLVVLLPMANIVSAATFSTAARSSSRSMKSGFSSQKSQPVRSNNYSNSYSNNSSNNSSNSSNTSSNTNKTSNTSFGSFGQQPNKAANRSDSALNKDLEKNQAQQQALKNMDARTQQKVAAQPEQQTSVTGKPLGQAYANSQPPSPVPQVAAAPTVIVQRESSSMSSMGSAFMGFMVGQALSRPHSAPSYDNRRNDLEPVAGGGDANYGNSNGVGTNNAGLTTAQVAPVKSESAAWSMLRFLLWTTFLSLFAWVIYKLYRVFVPRRQVVSHYSLGKV